MDITEYKKFLVKTYGKQIVVKDIDGMKYVDKNFMDWLVESMLVARNRVDKLNDELSRIIEHGKLPPDLPEGPAFEDSGADVFTDVKAAPAIKDNTEDLFRRGA